MNKKEIMKQITSKKLRKKWISFYESKGHKNIGAVSLIGEEGSGVMFNIAGMQPLMPYLLGKPHPMGKRLCNVQGCVRTVDIESVGDPVHFTFFEMMGNWSLGDYFKKEKTQWTYEILTKVFGLNGDQICCSVFAGDKDVPRDQETADLLVKAGIKPENIYFLGREDNWWQIDGTVGTPCGPDNEWFYARHNTPCSEHCDITCNCGRYVEIGNDVYMQYLNKGNGVYEPLPNKNVDTGFGFERMLMFLNGLTDGYKTDLFTPAITYLEKATNISYDADPVSVKAMRIVCDHMRTAVMLIGDVKGIVPSNVGAGYILRRLMRRAIRYAKQLNIGTQELLGVATTFIDDVYSEAYPNLVERKAYILQEIEKECHKFEKTLEQGSKEFYKLVENLKKFAPELKTIRGDKAFRLFDTYGFPLELTKEMAEEMGYTVDENGFKEAFEKHQQASKSQEKGVAKGGLVEQTEETTRLHTACHLLQAALRKVIGNTVFQKGSNITPERLRFDFSCDRAMTPEEIQKTEDLVNQAIQADIPIKCSTMTPEEAKKAGALGVFDSKYGDQVTVYKIGDVSHEICGGPHVKHTGELGTFKIVKEQSSSSGVRRIKAILQTKE